MGLNQPPQGLRPLINKSKQTAKVAVSIAPGDTLLVSDELAAQLQNSSSSLVDPATVSAPPAPAEEEIAVEDQATVAEPTDESADAPKRARKPKA